MVLCQGWCLHNPNGTCVSSLIFKAAEQACLIACFIDMEQRPVILKAKVDESTSVEETFQNEVLRPIIKLKHDLILAYTKHILAKKYDFFTLNEEMRLAYLSSCMEQNQTLRSELRGVVIGQFTVEEFRQYSKTTNTHNKRIMNIIKERMIDHLEVLSQPS